MSNWGIKEPMMKRDKLYKKMVKEKNNQVKMHKHESLKS